MARVECATMSMSADFVRRRRAPRRQCAPGRLTRDFRVSRAVPTQRFVPSGHKNKPSAPEPWSASLRRRYRRYKTRCSRHRGDIE